MGVRGRQSQVSPASRLSARLSAPGLHSCKITGTVFALPFFLERRYGVSVTPSRRASGSAGCGEARGNSWVGQPWGMDDCQLG